MGGIVSALGLVEEDEVPGLSMQALKSQDSTTSTALILLLKSNEAFKAFAQAEGDAILARDTEDGEKLAAGITLAQAKGVLDNKPAAPYAQIDVLGKTAQQVADEIIAALGAEFKGGVLVLVGLSGTGKGTTVDMLKTKLPNVVTWSNGNVFRSLTLLAATYCQNNLPGGAFDKAVLTPENLQNWMGMLKFGKFNDKFDIHIDAPSLGINLFVKDHANTTLKGPLVGKNIPTVAEVTQGEVVKFASAACKTMGDAGMSVLLEGREQTVDHIDSPHRFCLILSDDKLIGMRRAAQRIGAKALELVGPATEDNAAVAAVALALGQLTAVEKA